MSPKRIIGLLGIAGFIVMADNWVVSPILPAIAKQLGVSVSSAGLLISAYMIPFGVFQLVYGPLADRYGKKQVITFSMILFTLASGLCALGHGLTELALYRALTGVFAAAIVPISLALIGDLIPMEKRQGAIGTFMGICFLGQGLSMVIGGGIAYWLSWRWVFGIYALFAIVPTMMMLRAYRALPSHKNPQSRIFAPYAKLMADASSRSTYLLILLEGLFIIGAFSYLGAHIAAAFHFNYLLIGLTMTTFGLASVIGGRKAGAVAQKLGPRKLLTVGLAAAASANLMIAFGGQHLWITISSVTLLGFGFVFTHSTLLTRATQFADKSRGAAMSLVAFCFMGGGGLGTALGAKLIQSLSLSDLFLVYGLGLAIVLVLSHVLLRGQIYAAQPTAKVSVTR